MDRFPVEMDTSRLTGLTGPRGLGVGGLVEVCTCVAGNLFDLFNQFRICAIAWYAYIRAVSVRKPRFLPTDRRFQIGSTTSSEVLLSFLSYTQTQMIDMHFVRTSKHCRVTSCESKSVAAFDVQNVSAQMILYYDWFLHSNPGKNREQGPIILQNHWAAFSNASIALIDLDFSTFE